MGMKTEIAYCVSYVGLLALHRDKEQEPSIEGSFRYYLSR